MLLLDAHSTLGDWSNAWAVRKIVGRDYKYCQTVNTMVKHFEPISNVPICKIRTMHIDDIILALSIYNPTTKKPSSKKLLRNIRQTAIQIFNFAMNNCDDLYKNPAVYSTIPTHSIKTYRRSLNSLEQAMIVEIPHRARLAALIMMFCGLRVGEVVALNWEDIDFDKKLLSINKSAYNINGNQLAIKTGTKNGKSRTVPIPDILIQILLSAKGNKTGFVATKADGISMHTRSSWDRMWKSYTSKLGLDFTAHQLRHTYATILYAAGVDVKSASELLGHSTIEITMNIYTHLTEETKVISIEKFDLFLNDRYADIS